MTDANYKGLQMLQDRYAADGGQFNVLAYPCNQFGGQEPGDRDQILAFASKYDATFPMFEKVDVNGLNQHPLWKHLKQQKGELLGNDIKWNFAKFLVGRDGSVIKRYPPQVAPKDIEDDIVAALAEGEVGVVSPTGGAGAGVEEIPAA